ncbi:hypothetical protein ACWCSH_43455 [Streptosporangium sp. NPDC001682]
MLFSGALSALLVFVESLANPNWIALACLLGILLLGWELRAYAPHVDVRLLWVNRALNPNQRLQTCGSPVTADAPTLRLGCRVINVIVDKCPDRSASSPGEAAAISFAASR